MFKFKYWIYWIFLFGTHSLYALTTLTVTISSDNNPGGIGEIRDLRYCLNSMNQSLNSAPDDYAIFFASPMTIQLNGILPIINNSFNPVNITIGNPGLVSTVTIDGNSGAYSGFFIPIGNVTIQNMAFQNLTAKGGNGGNGISGGGMGAGGAIYAPQSFLNGSNPSITLMNVSISNCSAVLEGWAVVAESTNLVRRLREAVILLAGPSNGPTAAGGSDIGNLGGGVGGDAYRAGAGGGGGGSGLGAAIFVDSNLNFTLQALSGVPTTFNTPNNSTQAGIHGTGGPGGADGSDGSALGNSIFLRTGSSFTLMAHDTGDFLTLGDQVAFTDDTTFGAGGTSVFIKGNGSVIYNGTTDYQGTVTVNNANFKVNGQIDQAPVFVCRNSGFSSQRGTLSGSGTLTGNIFANSGTISPDTGETLTLGSLSLNSAASGSLGSLVHIEIHSGGTSLVAVTGATSLAGTLEINLAPTAKPGSYIILTSSGITGTFNNVTFTGNAIKTPNYKISYLPVGDPTYVQFDFLGYPSSSVEVPATVNGSPILNPAVVCCGRPVILGPLPVPGSGPTIYTISNQTGNVTCKIGQTKSQTYLKMYGKNGSCTIIGKKKWSCF